MVRTASMERTTFNLREVGATAKQARLLLDPAIIDQTASCYSATTTLGVLHLHGSKKIVLGRQIVR